jgi:hypothetical protein
MVRPACGRGGVCGSAVLAPIAGTSDIPAVSVHRAPCTVWAPTGLADGIPLPAIVARVGE